MTRNLKPLVHVHRGEWCDACVEHGAARDRSRLDVEADAIISELRALIAIMEERISIREKTT